jgi:hypothetical protein
MRSPEPHCEVALMLCESLIHLLVEEGVIAKEKAIEAVEGVAELACEMAERDAKPDTKRAAAMLAETIAASFRLKD